MISFLLCFNNPICYSVLSDLLCDLVPSVASLQKKPVDLGWQLVWRARFKFIPNILAKSYDATRRHCTTHTKASVLALAQSKLRLSSANHRTGYISNLDCDWLSWSNLDCAQSEFTLSKRQRKTGPNLLWYNVIDWYIHGLVQDCSNSSTLAMELLQSCTKPSI